MVVGASEHGDGVGSRLRDSTKVRVKCLLRGRKEVHQSGQPLVGARLRIIPWNDDEKDRQHPRCSRQSMKMPRWSAATRRPRYGRRRDDDGERGRAEEEHLHQLQRQKAQEQRAAVIVGLVTRNAVA